MPSRLMITFITRGDDLEQHVPGGFGFVDEVFAEAGLRDPISAEHSDSLSRRLRIVQRALAREFRGKIELRVVNPWSPGGLWLMVRHRLRDFPCMLIDGRSYAVEMPVEELIEIVRSVFQTKYSADAPPERP